VIASAHLSAAGYYIGRRKTWSLQAKLWLSDQLPPINCWLTICLVAFLKIDRVLAGGW